MNSLICNRDVIIMSGKERKDPSRKDAKKDTGKPKSVTAGAGDTGRLGNK